MRNREITFILRLRNEARNNPGFSLGGMAKQLNQLSRSGSEAQRAQARALAEQVKLLDRAVKAQERAERAAGTGARSAAARRLREEERLADRARRNSRTEELHGIRAATSAERQRTAEVIRRGRVEQETYKTFERRGTALANISRAEARALATRQQGEHQSLINAQRRSAQEERNNQLRRRGQQNEQAHEEAMLGRRARTQRAVLAAGTQQVRMQGAIASGQQRAAMAAQRLANAKIAGERSAVMLQRQQLALQAQQLRLVQQQYRIQQQSGGGRSGMFRNGMADLAGSFGGALAIGGIVHMADEYRMLEARIRLVTESEQEHEAVMHNIITMANETRVSLRGTSDVYYSLARNNQALGLSQRELLDITETINQSVAVSGTSAQAAAFGLIQLGQAFGTGTLRGEELNSVLEQLPALAQIIARGVGVDVPGALKTLAETGDLTVPMVIEAIQAGREEIERMFAEMPITVSGGLQTLKNGLQVFIAEVDRASGATDGLGRAFYNMGLWLSNPENAASVGRLVNSLGQLVSLVGGALTSAFNFFRENIWLVKTAVILLSGVIATRLIGGAIVGLITAFRTGGAAVATFARVLLGARTAMMVTGATATVALGPISIAIMAIAAAAAAVIAAIWIFQDEISAAMTATMAVVNDTGDDFKTLRWEASETARVVSDANDEIIKSLGNGVKDTQADLGEFGQWFYDFHMGMTDTLGEFVMKIVRAQDFVVRGYAAMAAGAAAAMNAMGRAVTSTGHTIAETLRSLGRGFMSFVTGQWGDIEGNLAGITGQWQDFSDQLTSIPGEISAAMAAARDATGTPNADAATEWLAEARARDSRIIRSWFTEYENALKERRRMEQRLTEVSEEGFDPPERPGNDREGERAAQRLANQWESLLRTLNPARDALNNTREALELLNNEAISGVARGSAAYNAYAEAIDRAYGDRASPYGEQLYELNEEIRLLGISNDAIRERTRLVDELMREQAEYDPENLMGRNTEAARQEIEAKLILRDQLQLRTQMVQQSDQLIDSMNQEMVLSGLVGGQLEAQRYAYQEFNEWKRQGLVTTWEEFVALTDIENVMARITDHASRRDTAQLVSEINREAQEALATAQTEWNLRTLVGPELQVELAIHRMINTERLRGVAITYEQARAALEAAGALDAIRQTEAINQRANTDPFEGAKRAMRDWMADVRNVGSAVGDVITNALSGATDAIVEFAMTGKMNFADFARNVIADILRLITRLLIMAAIVKGLEAIGVPAGAILQLTAGTSRVGVGHSGGIAGRGGSGGRNVNPLVFAGAPRYHNGGIVGLRSGEVPAILKQNEAVMPTVRLPDGSFGVRAIGAGAGGGSTNILSPHIEVHVNGGAGGGANADPAQQQRMGNEVGRAVETAMNEWAIKQQRPGGILWKGR